MSLLLSIPVGRLYVQGGLIYDLGLYDSLFSSSCACILTSHKSHVNERVGKSSDLCPTSSSGIMRAHQRDRGSTLRCVYQLVVSWVISARDMVARGRARGRIQHLPELGNLIRDGEAISGCMGCILLLGYFEVISSL